ncbi:hypothetical protein ACH5RR_013348 [Cinchona calisaya]|uniref:Uncharacterized protein n=1 Tax=Cinchona calisaya TaxID=153742 RepID=A0ABD2ZZT5_9GENT
MPPSAHVSASLDDNNETWVSINAWLEGQDKGSVVYLALGSEKLVGSSKSFELPDRFEEQVKERGIVWKGWAPQLKILSHDSVGGFSTHCCWNSTVEGIMFGLPLIILPFLVDQGLNARVLKNNRAEIEVPRNEEDRSYTSDSVAKSVRLIMVEHIGMKYRDRDKELSVIFGDRKLHDLYLENSNV